jgi:hypothetical protein
LYKFNYLSLLILLIAIIVSGCEDDRFPEGDFHIVIISDTHISKDESKDGRLRQLITKINNDKIPNVHLVFNTGDAVSRIYGDYTSENRDTSDDRAQRYLDLINQLSVPAFTALGNHDYKIGPDVDSDDPFSKEQIELSESIWQGKGDIYPYYSLDYSSWKFIVLNSMRGRYLERNFDPDQLKWLESELAQEIPSVLFFHHPIETDHFRFWASFKDLIDEDMEPEFFSMCNKYKQNIKAIFVGHGHTWTKDTLFDSIKVYETSSFGDDEDSPFYLAGFDTTEFRIDVVDSETLLLGKDDLP